MSKTGKCASGWTLGALRAAVLTAALMAVLTMAQSAWAQTEGVRPPSRDLVTNIVNTLVFGLLGIALAGVGFKVFDLIIKHDIEKEIFDNKNMAAAVLSGFVVLGVCVIVAATISAP